MKFFFRHTKEGTEIFLYFFFVRVLCWRQRKIKKRIWENKCSFTELQFCFIYTFKYVHLIIFRGYLATIIFKCLFGSCNNGDRGIMNHSVTENNSKLIRIGRQIFLCCILCCKIICGFETTIWDRGSTVVKVLCYKSEGRWFDPRLCQWIFLRHIILPIALWPWGRLSL